VDYIVRRELLAGIGSGSGDDFMSRLDEGVPKLRLTATTLAVRARQAEAFGTSSLYQPLAVHGSRAQHAICFSRARSDGEPATVTVAFRWPLLLDGLWDDTTLRVPDGVWRNVLTGQEISGGEQALADLLAHAPVALLERG
jgi:(1->4)-alpha-D-glucan 1-alpha-D-glucosylmutase